MSDWFYPICFSCSSILKVVYKILGRYENFTRHCLIKVSQFMTKALKYNNLWSNEGIREQLTYSLLFTFSSCQYCKGCLSKGFLWYILSFVLYLSVLSHSIISCCVASSQANDTTGYITRVSAVRCNVIEWNEEPFSTVQTTGN